MLSSIKVCDYFFDVAVHCKMVESPHREFFNCCMNEKHDRKTSFAIMRKETCFAACCNDILKAMVKKKDSISQCWHRIVFTLAELNLDLKMT